jgi:AGCS family alanine or glycine:cation symporter
MEVKMENVTQFFYALDDFMWGSWMTILILATGILLSLRFRFRYQRSIVFNFKNTFAKMLSEGEGEGTISGFKAACTALANTVGT